MIQNRDIEECFRLNESSNGMKYYLPLSRYLTATNPPTESMMKTVMFVRDEIPSELDRVQIVFLFCQKQTANVYARRITNPRALDYIFKEYPMGYFVRKVHTAHVIMVTQLLSRLDVLEFHPPVPLYLPSAKTLVPDADVAGADSSAASLVPLKRIMEIIKMYIERFVNPANFYDPKLPTEWWPNHSITKQEDKMSQLFFLYMVGRHGSAEWIRMVTVGYSNIFDYYEKIAPGSVIRTADVINGIVACMEKARERAETISIKDTPLFLTISMSYLKEKLSDDAVLAAEVARMILKS